MRRRLLRILAAAAAMTLLGTAAASATPGAPDEGSLRLSPVRTADPFGGPAHTFGTFTTTIKANNQDLAISCFRNLRLDRGQLGTTNPANGAFEPTTLEDAMGGGYEEGNYDGCTGGLPMTWISMVAAPNGQTVTLDGGWFGPGITAVAIDDGGRWKPVPHTAGGQFLVALPGLWSPEPGDNAKLLPQIRVKATLCGPHARFDLLNTRDAARTGKCELTGYWPGRPTSAVSKARRHKRHR